MSFSRDTRARRGLRRIALALLLSLAGCDEPPPEYVEIAPIEAAPPSLSPAPLPAPIEAAPAPAPPAPVRAPAPDPEALARAREDAARARFEREYPWHGVAYHFVAQVYKRPDTSSPVIGYMRRGAPFRAQAGLRGPGCARGWHRVSGGGYVCRGAGFQLGDVPQTIEGSPVGPILDGALPYAYAWVARDDVPQYWRLPTAEEETQVRAWISRQRAIEDRAARAAETATPVRREEGEAEVVAAEPDLEAPPGLDAHADEENSGPPDAGVPHDAGTPTVDEQPSLLRMRMRRGFYVSIDRLETVEGRRFYRTIRGAYVPADAITEAAPPAMRGVVLGGRWSLPLGFVYRGGVRSLSRDTVRGVLRMADEVDRLTPLPLGEEIVVRQGHRFRVSDRGRIVREDAMRIARPIERPTGIPAGSRWVHVDLREQILVAYEGDRPVFATMVSTGREGFQTPTGTFRIQSKHVSTTMDDPTAGAEAYSIEDVPWTMYFEGSYALHAAFWHDRFGRPRSHGCVNLAPADARWVFEFTGPELPAGWHGMSAGREAPGSFVYITAPE